jgi:hypothetical protein
MCANRLPKPSQREVVGFKNPGTQVVEDLTPSLFHRTSVQQNPLGFGWTTHHFSNNFSLSAELSSSSSQSSATPRSFGTDTSRSSRLPNTTSDSSTNIGTLRKCNPSVGLYSPLSKQLKTSESNVDFICENVDRSTSRNSRNYNFQTCTTKMPKMVS